MQTQTKASCLTGILLALSFLAMAQTVTPLAIGQAFPVEKLVQALQPSQKGKLSEKAFAGKAILLDFWNIWCHGCWNGKSKLEALQKSFHNDIVIVEITANSGADVAGMYKKLNREPPALLSITDDQQLGRYFPHRGDPLHVWIDRKGIVRQITYGYNATEENLLTFLKEQPLQLARRGDLGTVDHPKSLFQHAASALKQEVQAYSLLVSGLHEYAGIRHPDSKTGTGQHPTLSFWNVGLLDLYRAAYFRDLYGYDQPRFFDGNNRICLEVKDSTAFFRRLDSSGIDWWNQHFLYSYELYLPRAQTTDPFGAMQADLLRFFPYTVTIETRTVASKVLTWLTPEKKFFSQPAEPGKDDHFAVKDTTLQPLIDYLTTAFEKDPQPFLTDVEFNNTVSLSLTADEEDLSSLRKELQAYGLDLREECRAVKMLVIRDRH